MGSRPDSYLTPVNTEPSHNPPISDANTDAFNYKEEAETSEDDCYNESMGSRPDSYLTPVNTEPSHNPPISDYNTDAFNYKEEAETSEDDCDNESMGSQPDGYLTPVNTEPSHNPPISDASTDAFNYKEEAEKSEDDCYNESMGSRPDSYLTPVNTEPSHNPPISDASTDAFNYKEEAEKSEDGCYNESMGSRPDSYLTPVNTEPSHIPPISDANTGAFNCKEEAEKSEDDCYNDPSYLTPVQNEPSHKSLLPDSLEFLEIDMEDDEEEIKNGRKDSYTRHSLNGWPDDQVQLPLPSNTVKNRSAYNSNRNAPADQMFSQWNTAHTHHSHKEDENDLQYSVEDTPPWYLCLALGFQHFIIMFGATVTNPLLMAEHLCIPEDDYKGRSQLIGTIFFMSGIVTLIQTFLGVRLPIVQGGTLTFVTPSIAILSLSKWDCPEAESSTADALSTMNDTTAAMYSAVTDSMVTKSTLTEGPQEAIWYSRIREIQGAIIVASMFQVVIGFSGIMAFLLRWIGPLTIAPSIALAGLSLFNAASDRASKQWWIALVTVILIAMFSQYTKNIGIPCCKYKRGHKLVRISFPIFRLFPVILAVVITWIIVWILIAAKVFSSDVFGFNQKEGVQMNLLKESAWFRIPYPGQWGRPTVSAPSVFGMLAGVLASMLESVGDYYACARIARVPPPPMHAMNRGIAIEGIGCILAGAFGTGSGTTSYSENIGAIGITKVASRMVIQVGAVMMIFFGIFTKFGAVFLTLPDPIIGGVFIVMFGMITAVGISNLQFVDMNSSRNLFIIGFSLAFGLTLPDYIKENKNAIQTGNDVVNEIIIVFLETSMFVGSLAGFVLDNTIPGTDEERGLTRWRQTLIKHEKSRRGPDDPYSAQKSVYQIPALSTYLKKFTWTKYIPFLPTFDEDLFKVKNRLPGRKNKKEKSNKNSTTCSGDGNNRVIDTAV